MKVQLNAHIQSVCGRRDNVNYNRLKVFAMQKLPESARKSVIQIANEKIKRNREIIREAVESRWKVLGLAAAPVVAGTWDDE